MLGKNRAISVRGRNVMAGNNESSRGPVGFRTGDVVEVKSKEEILATLDEHGEFDSLRFMPEMLQFCGQQIHVFRRAVKTCDGAANMYRMHETVHLQGARCDGSAHGGCQAGCLIYWKEEWLRPVDSSTASSSKVHQPLRDGSRGITEAQLAETTCEVDPDAPGEVRYRCQATEVWRAAPETIAKWDVAAWIRDVRSGNAGIFQMLRAVLIMLFNLFQRANQKFLPGLTVIRGAQAYPFISGRLKKTPRRKLDLQPGELVRVKSFEEIEATLDTKNCNRGLSFDREMLKYCGREARVLRRVERIIDENTGWMRELPGDCIILEDVYCQGTYNKYCPRAIYSYWREIWLERVQPDVASTQPALARSEAGIEQ
jgi:hypothetical protein